jgi:hypothetical protein
MTTALDPARTRPTDGVPGPTSALAPSVRDQVGARLFATPRGDSFALDAASRADLAALQASWDDLDPDRFFGGEPGKAWRVRRYSDFDFEPASGRLLQRRAHVPYYQSERQNAYVGGIVREFGDVAEETAANPLFQRLVAWDFAQWPVDARYLDRTWICQVHQLRIYVVGGHTSAVTPEGIHSDGYPFAGVHLMARVDVSGGQSTVYTADAEPLASLTFERPLDSLLFEDRRMKHYVTPITGAPGRTGHRDVLAISFSLPDSPYTTDV